MTFQYFRSRKVQSSRRTRDNLLIISKLRQKIIDSHLPTIGTRARVYMASEIDIKSLRNVILRKFGW